MTKFLSQPRHQRLLTHPSILQFTKYVFSGFITLFLDLSTTNLLVFAFHVDERWAGYAGISVALVNGFIMNRNWTFRAQQGHIAPQAVRFTVVAAIGATINALSYTYLLHWTVIHFDLAKLIAGAIGAAWNFTLMKIWVFARQKSDIDSAL